MRPKKVILCVDDNEQILSTRCFMLETKGYRVLRATDGAEALAMLAEHVPGTVDLLLTDLLMPKMDGRELAMRAKLLHPSLPVMMVSGTVTCHERGGGADVFLPKGCASAAEMAERARILVARKRGPKKKPVASETMPVLEAIAV